MWDDKSNTKKVIFNAEDGLIFKGVEEILKECEECDKFMACDDTQMQYRFNKTRRNKLNNTCEWQIMHPWTEVLYD